MKRVFAAMVLSALLGAPAAAAPKPAACNGQIAITSDRFVADSNSKTGTWSGNVVVAQCEIRMRADSVRADMAPGKSDQIDRIHANGHVVVDSPSAGTVTGDNGVYEVASRVVTLTGHVILNKDRQGVMSGSQLTVNLVTGVAQVTAKGTPTGRVQGLFSAPQSSSQAAPQSGAN